MKLPEFMVKHWRNIGFAPTASIGMRTAAPKDSLARVGAHHPLGGGAGPDPSAGPGGAGGDSHEGGYIAVQGQLLLLDVTACGGLKSGTSV